MSLCGELVTDIVHPVGFCKLNHSALHSCVCSGIFLSIEWKHKAGASVSKSMKGRICELLGLEATIVDSLSRAPGHFFVA